MTSLTPFKVDIPQQRLDNILQRVHSYEWHETPVEGGEWDYGVSLDYLRELASYWIHSYDWRAAEANLNAWPQFRCAIGDMDLHFYYVKGKGPKTRPLILTHGWPGSVFEFLHQIGPLTDPVAYGGHASDAFDIVIPSLPGYGFSGKPASPVGPRRIAGMFHELMTQALGYNSYMAQGGDWGSTISAWLGFDHAHACHAIHLNQVGTRPGHGSTLTLEEKSWLRASKEHFQRVAGYFLLQTNMPQTIGAAMMDSPVGVAAMMVDMFRSASDRRGDELGSRFSKDQMLTNIMIYLTTRTFNTAGWLYYGIVKEQSSTLPSGCRVEVPVAVANFPLEAGIPPRSFVEKGYNVVRWTNIERGGHFASLEEPQLFIEDVRAFARELTWPL